MSRFFVSPSAVTEDVIRITDPGDVKHIRKVLRMRLGDAVEVSDGDRWEYAGAIEAIADDQVVIRIADKQAFARELALEVTLYQGIPKAGKLETVVQKCTELGVYAVVPVFMKRSVVTAGPGLDRKLERLQRVADEAVKQCRRGRIPQVGPAMTFGEMLQALPEADVVLFPYENEEKRTLKDVLRSIQPVPRSVAIVIGPEGGFSEEEAQALDQAGAHRASLGKTILRTETAGMAALAMTLYEWEL